MTNAELLAKIKAEIERLKENVPCRYHPYSCASVLEAYEKLLSFLSTLESEKPTSPDGLDKEIKRYIDEYYKEDCIVLIAHVARHFAQWGAEHAKIDVTDLCKPIDPGIAQCIADHSWEMLGEDETPVPNGLEEVAVNIADNLLAKPKDYALSAKADYWNGVHDGVIAGAKWQAEQLLKGSPLPEDTVLFNKGVEEGKRLILKDAVKGEVYKFGEVAYVKERSNAELTKYLSQFNNGDSVKIIVIHETDIR